MKFSRFFNLIIALALVCALVPSAPARAQAPLGEITRDTEFIPGQVVVAFEEGLSAQTYAARANALAGSVGALVASSYSNVALLETDPNVDPQALAAEMVRAGQALAAQPNYVYWMPEKDSTILGDPLVTPGYSVASTDGRALDLSWDEAAALNRMVKKSGKYRAASTFPRELFSGRLWGWDAVEADLIWNNSSSGVPYVAVLDTGVDYNHPDLRGRVSNGYDFYNDDKLSADDNGHGTHVAGIIAAKSDYNYKNDESAAGVSNGKVLAVKVLGAQGNGTSYSLAAGIIYAAKNRSVKVINLSLAGPKADEIVYWALHYAIKDQGKLVVAAAGNDSTSDPRYPAAWADPSISDPSNDTNDISDGLIAVGAARAPRPDGLEIWVDRNDDGLIDDDTETFSSEECAWGYYDPDEASATGTNYGKWVSIVAPGDSIYSTTPVNNPFYLNSYHEVASGYDYLSGSSMAAAFVAGAAARVYGKGILSSPNASDVKNKLVEEGNPLKFASQGNNGGTDLDETSGFDNTPSMADYFGIPYPETPPEGVEPYIMAPFCWPETHGEFTADQDMTGTVYLNVADAMDRGALWSEIKDAATGLPLEKAAVAAYDQNSGSRKGYAKTTAKGSNVVMINLPVKSDGSTTYELKVSKSGYTSGYQTFNTIDMPDDGTVVMDNYSSVSVPAKLNINLVLDWMNTVRADTSDAYGEPDLDLLIKLPDGKGFIGPDSSEFSDIWDEDYLGVGTLLDPSKFTAGFEFTGFAPYAQHFFDGGVHSGKDGEGALMSPTEYAAIKYGSKVKGSPYYTPKYEGDYEIYVTDIRDGEANYLTLDPEDPERPRDIFVAPIVRVWSNGYLIKDTKLEDITTCRGDGNWWHALTLNGANTPLVGVNGCVDTPPQP